MALLDPVRNLLGARKKNRYDLINHLVRSRGYRSYLEIGVRRGACFEMVEGVDKKVGVDPAPSFTKPEWDVRRLTSDAYFEQNRNAASPERFDLIFIDGLHLSEQVLADIYNSLEALEPGGCLVLHDCHPASEAAASRDVSRSERSLPWNGDVWKAFAWVRREEPKLFCRVVDFDHGLGFITRATSDSPFLDRERREEAIQTFETWSYAELAQNAKQLLGLVPSIEALEQELKSALGAGTGNRAANPNGAR